MDKHTYQLTRRGYQNETVLALLLVALMLIGLCACGNGAQEGEQSAQGTKQTHSRQQNKR